VWRSRRVGEGACVGGCCTWGCWADGCVLVGRVHDGVGLIRGGIVTRVDVEGVC